MKAKVVAVFSLFGLCAFAQELPSPPRNGWEAKVELMAAVRQETKMPIFNAATTGLGALGILWLTQGEVTTVESLDDAARFIAESGGWGNVDTIVNGLNKDLEKFFKSKAKEAFDALEQAVASNDAAGLENFKDAIRRIIPDYVASVEKELGIVSGRTFPSGSVSYFFGREIDPSVRSQPSLHRPEGRAVRVTTSIDMGSLEIRYNHATGRISMRRDRGWLSFHRRFYDYFIRPSEGALDRSFGARLMNLLIDKKVGPFDAPDPDLMARMAARDAGTYRYVRETERASAPRPSAAVQRRAESAVTRSTRTAAERGLLDNPRLLRYAKYGLIGLGVAAAGYLIYRLADWVLSEESLLDQQLDESIRSLGYQDDGIKSRLRKLVLEVDASEALIESIRNLDDRDARVLWNFIYVPKS